MKEKNYLVNHRYNDNDTNACDKYIRYCKWFRNYFWVKTTEFRSSVLPFSSLRPLSCSPSKIMKIHTIVWIWKPGSIHVWWQNPAKSNSVAVPSGELRQNHNDHVIRCWKYTRPRSIILLPANFKSGQGQLSLIAANFTPGQRGRQRVVTLT